MTNDKKNKPVVLKQCRKCGEEKPITEFGVHTSTPDRLKTWCSECYRLYNAERYEKNKEKMNAQARAWNEANPGRVKKIAKAWRDNQKS